MRIPSPALLLLVALGCAHAPQSTGLPGLRPAAEEFHRRLRWKDFRGAEELLIAERREAFERALRRDHDERDLSITDYDLEEARLLPGGMRAEVISRLNWVRLPSASEQTASVTSEWVFRNGTWYLAGMDAGPFARELSAPLPAPDAGVAAP